MTLNDIFIQIKDFQKQSGTKSVPQSSVVSPLFPGQFNYCLDEIHLFEKYGDFIEITDDEHFHKIQPAIRLADFDRFFFGNEKSNYHLGTFTISTINGGHIVPAEQGEAFYRKAVIGILDFLTNHLGLKKDKISVSYFSGGATAKDVEASRKKNGQLLKVDVNIAIPEDVLSKEVLLDNGLKKDQLHSNNTRDNFLTTNWDVQKPLSSDQYIRAPWGYRNEIFYTLDNGDVLDIATIERLTMAPIVENRNGVNFVVDVQPWQRCFVIDACGLERLEIATSNLSSILNLPAYKKLIDIGVTPLQAESTRILHRIFTDSTWQKISSKQRRQKINKLIRSLNGVPQDVIRELLRLNAYAYGSIFPELSDGVERTVSEILNYREGGRDEGRAKKKRKIDAIKANK